MKGCLAIIAARGGSKRIPGKNIKNFLGKPIIEYSIAAAQESGCFEEVMVSTDDLKIAEIARSNGANVPFIRSAEAASDFATTAEVVTEVLREYAIKGKHFDYCCCIYPTAPFITPIKLRSALDLLIDKQAASIIPVVRFSYPIQRSLKVENGFAQMNWPEYKHARSQDLKPSFHDCGQFYFLRTSAFNEERELFMKNSVAMEMNELEVQDIDTLEDWKLAELKYQIMISNYEHT